MTPFVGAGAVVLDKQGALLLVVETGPGKNGRWSLPAGKVEAGESAVAAMRREVLEETGVTVDAVDLLGMYHSVGTSEGVYGVNLVFRAMVAEGVPTPSEEHPEVRFIGRTEIADMLADGVFRSGELMETVLADLDEARSLPLSTVRTIGEA